MCRGAAETGLFQEERQLRIQGDSTTSDGLNHGVVLQHKLSGTKLVIEDTKNTTETISPGKVRSLVQVIPTISA